MVLKRQLGEEGSDRSSSFSYSQGLQTKFQKVVKHVMKDASLQEIAEKIAVILEPTFRRVVKEELEQHISACLHSSPRRSLVQQPESYPSRELQLVFTAKFPSKLFTNSKIKDKEHALVQVKLIDANTKNLIQNSQLSSLKVEIVVLNGGFAGEREYWTENEFNDNIVNEREGKRPLLIGELFIVLVNGVGSLEKIIFTDNSSWIRSRKFKLGVRPLLNASAGIGIKEAVSEPFVVLDNRGESYQKHSKPFLDDPVWRLRKISKVGALCKRLESNGINTVKDFLRHYYMNPSSLQNVLGKSVANRAWDTMVKHANDCNLDSTYYRYYCDSESIELVFNCVYKVIAVKFAGRDYQTLDSLNSREKSLVEKLKQSAYSNLDELILVQSSPAIADFEPSVIEHNIPVYSSDLQHDDFSMMHQEQPENHLEYNLSDTASYPSTTPEETSYIPSDKFDLTSQTDQQSPVHWLAQSSFITGESSSIPTADNYNWYPESSNLTFIHNTNLSEDLSHSQTVPWGEDSNFFTIFPPYSGSVPFQSPEYDVSVRGNGSRKAGWCKIRAAIKWKIVRRNVAARRNRMSPFFYKTVSYKNL